MKRYCWLQEWSLHSLTTTVELNKCPLASAPLLDLPHTADSKVITTFPSRWPMEILWTINRTQSAAHKSLQSHPRPTHDTEGH